MHITALLRNKMGPKSLPLCRVATNEVVGNVQQPQTRKKEWVDICCGGNHPNKLAQSPPYPEGCITQALQDALQCCQANSAFCVEWSTDQIINVSEAEEHLRRLCRAAETNPK